MARHGLFSVLVVSVYYQRIDVPLRGAQGANLRSAYFGLFYGSKIENFGKV